MTSYFLNSLSKTDASIFEQKPKKILFHHPGRVPADDLVTLFDSRARPGVLLAEEEFLSVGADRGNVFQLLTKNLFASVVSSKGPDHQLLIRCCCFQSFSLNHCLWLQQSSAEWWDWIKKREKKKNRNDSETKETNQRYASAFKPKDSGVEKMQLLNQQKTFI